MGLPVFLIFGHFFYAFVQISSLYYGLKMLFPIVFAGMVYRNRNRGVKGMLLCLVLGMLEMVWYQAAYEVFGNGVYTVSAAQAENGLIIGVILLFAIGKGIFGREKKKQIWTLLIIAGGLCFIGLLLFQQKAVLKTYVWHRIMAIFDGSSREYGYMNTLLKNAISNASLFGGQPLFHF